MMKDCDCIDAGEQCPLAASQGSQAYIDGKNLEDNPYSEDNNKKQLWQLGWFDADRYYSEGA